ncbi:MAG: hypothetical protein PHG05_04190 [Candidatus Nanoarchaeia archaeon]|nr:hypothetical protein [Candidatus Nanoarchaeia archaeon]
MKLTLIKEQEMPLLLRKRLTYEVEFEKSTPRKEDVKKEIAKATGVPEEHIKLRHLYQKYGTTKAKAIVNVYKNAEDLKRVEEIKKKKKKDGKKESKEQGAK